MTNVPQKRPPGKNERSGALGSRERLRQEFLMGHREPPSGAAERGGVGSSWEASLEGILQLCTIIPERLYFATLHHASVPKPHPRLHFFSTDKSFTYAGFYEDFGPLHLGMLYRYCMKLRRKLRTVLLSRKKIVHCTSPDARKRANAVYLIGCFAVLFLKMAPRDVARVLSMSGPPFLPFRDASQVPCTYPLHLGECFCAVLKASHEGLLDFGAFDVEAFEYYRRSENGNMTWIVPRRLLAFAGPHSETHVENGCTYRHPEYYVSFFKRNGVNAVIRLNEASTYDARRFTDHGIKHYDLPFDDGTPPPKEVLYKFLDIVESTAGAVAVHCKAGLGRTGSLIASYLIKHYQFTPSESIAWTRICRPGSIIGPQQQFLERVYVKLTGKTCSQEDY